MGGNVQKTLRKKKGEKAFFFYENGIAKKNRSSR